MDKKLNSGFTLVEVTIALVLLSIFAIAFLYGQSGNYNDSIRMRELLTLHRLTDSKIQEAIINLPQFSGATETDIKEGKFDGDYEDYSFQIHYQKFTIPNFEQIMKAQTENKEGEEENQSQEETATANNSYISVIYKKLQENLEKMIWQVEVIVTNNLTKETYRLSRWVRDPKAKIDAKFQ